MFGTKAVLMLSSCALSHRPAYLIPTKIPSQDKLPNMLAVNQSPDLQLKNPNSNNKVSVHVILIGVADTIYKDNTMKPLVN
eukprot:1047268-Pelagomonas_calceolata.AAC.1